MGYGFGHRKKDINGLDAPGIGRPGGRGEASRTDRQGNQSVSRLGCLVGGPGGYHLCIFNSPGIGAACLPGHVAPFFLRRIAVVWYWFFISTPYEREGGCHADTKECVLSRTFTGPRPSLRPQIHQPQVQAEVQTPPPLHAEAQALAQHLEPDREELAGEARTSQPRYTPSWGELMQVKA